MDSFQGRTALVTGASSGIGLALARDLAGRGADVIVAARSKDKLEAVAEEIRAGGGRAHVFVADLGEAGSAERLYAEIAAAGLRVDLLVNNAGYGRWGEFLSFDREDNARMVQLNITSLTELCHLAIPDMIERGGGGVINIGSTASFVPVPYSAVYGATKGYVIKFTEALRFEYAGKGVRIMTICPGATASNFAAVASEKSSEALKNLNAKMTKDNKMGQPCEEVAKEGLDAFLNDKICAVTGKGNWQAPFFARILPRERALKIVGNLFRRRTAN